MDFVPLIIQLISGAVGGNAAGALLKNINQGTLINSVAGIIGGGLGGQILGAVLGGAAPEAGGMDISGIIGSIAGGGVGGGVRGGNDDETLHFRRGGRWRWRRFQRCVCFLIYFRFQDVRHRDSHLLQDIDFFRAHFFVLGILLYFFPFFRLSFRLLICDTFFS